MHFLAIIPIFLKFSSSQPPENTFHLGFLHCDNVDSTAPYINYRTSASAASIAIERIQRENILSNYSFRITILFDNCNNIQAAGSTIELIRDYDVDVIFGPTTNSPALISFVIGTRYNIPMVAWGLTSSSVFDDNTRFPTSGVMSAGSKSVGIAFREIMLMFEWDQFVFVYSLEDDSDGQCYALRDDIQDLISYHGNPTISYSLQLLDLSVNGMRNALHDISKRGRIIVSCFPNGNINGLIRQWILLAYENGFATDEYVYIFPSLRSKGFTVVESDGSDRYAWVDPSGPSVNDSDAILGFQKAIFIVDMLGQSQIAENYSVFSSEVISRMKDPPYNCTTACSSVDSQNAATYAGQLHDSVYAYGVTMSKMMKEDPKNYRNGTAFLTNFQQNFSGISGPVSINNQGIRNPTLYVLILDRNNSPKVMSSVYVNYDNGVVSKNYSDEATDVWWNRDGIRPLDEPVCGFTGSKCPVNVILMNLGWFIVAACVVILALLAAMLAIFFMIRAKLHEVRRQNALWQIPCAALIPMSKKCKGDQSMRSISSDPSTVSSKSEGLSESRHYQFFTIQIGSETERVAARKHNIRVVFDSKACAFMRQMRQIDHVNLNRFIGICLDSSQLLSIWRFCSRGSLSDVIRKATIQMDGFFIYSLMKDIVNGLLYIHNSSIVSHGMLSSRSCLLNDRWQLKITDFGMKQYRTHAEFNNYDLLWTAPEHLRDEDLNGSKEGDIYSFAIISSELITRRSVFDIENRKEDADELVYMIKKGGKNGARPEMEIDDAMDINPSMLHLVRDCWSERPSERPDINQVWSQLRGLNTNRNDNLMDHVFNVLESYASNLEDEVSQRMKELVEEKKKSDVLLYRMLPKQVADKLKLGQTVEPETFDLVTLFFSDVVGFTTIASKCTPLQVVNLLNDLYTIFDGIIDQHDIYKVETIGDGYLCVSGLPHRNGNEHIRHIANMSLGFIKSLSNFRIHHLPEERIRIRIGFHCGSVITGVVGLSMPRYCLFGDAVNTASRMESNSQPGRIHISTEANSMLMRVGGFRTEHRGEVIVKGHGVMNTYWLLDTEKN